MFSSAPRLPFVRVQCLLTWYQHKEIKGYVFKMTVLENLRLLDLSLSPPHTHPFLCLQPFGKIISFRVCLKKRGGGRGWGHCFPYSFDQFLRFCFPDVFLSFRVFSHSDPLWVRFQDLTLGPGAFWVLFSVFGSQEKVRTLFWDGGARLLATFSLILLLLVAFPPVGLVWPRTRFGTLAGNEEGQSLSSGLHLGSKI